MSRRCARKPGRTSAPKWPESARNGTRANMLGPGLLDAEHYPQIRIDSRGMKRSAVGYDVELAIVVRGKSNVVQVPVALARSADRIAASGEFVLRQSQLGLTPFSVMMGALQVQDAMRLRFTLVAQPQASTDDAALGGVLVAHYDATRRTHDGHDNHEYQGGRDDAICTPYFSG